MYHGIINIQPKPVLSSPLKSHSDYVSLTSVLPYIGKQQRVTTI